MYIDIDSINEDAWSRVEHQLIPNPSKDGSNQIGVIDLLPQLVFVPIAITTGLLAAAAKIMRIGYHYIHPPAPAKLNNDFTDVVNDSRNWAKYPNIEEELEKHPLGEGNKEFDFGSATCSYQDSGKANFPESQWAPWEDQRIPNPADRSGKSADLITLYKTNPSEVINRIKQLGVTSYRFSVEWSHIQPAKNGPFNQANLQVYVDFCKELRINGIKPAVTLHHFSEPLWWHNEGSFEKPANIHYFVKFAEAVFDALTVDFNGKPLVEKFFTINEPAIEAFSRFVRGAYPSNPEPNKQSATGLFGKIFEYIDYYLIKSLDKDGTYCNFKRAGHFLHGALRAHTEVYNRLKEKNSDIQIGIVHQYLRAIPTTALQSPVTRYITHLVNEVPFHYFKIGEFLLKTPFCHIQCQDKIPNTDFVGLQYYVRPIIGMTGPTSFHNEPRTLMPMHEDPEGLYEAIVETHKHFNVPVEISENGISSRNDDQRNRYNMRALFAAKQAAAKIGVENVRSYYYWSFVRNLEWEMGMNSQDFGAYDLLPDGKIADQPKPGMESFVKVVEAFNAWKLRQKSA
ncbi:MAG: family 1 glycosylhydrolase [Rhabdochlamydiaceae bacterium]|jgi:beta-glucosidase